MGKLQEVEGIIKGMLMTLDIRIGTDIVVIKSSLYVNCSLGIIKNGALKRPRK